MKLNRKALLTLLTTAILFTPNSERHEKQNEDVTFKFYDSKKLVEEVKEGCHYNPGNEKLQIILDDISKNFDGIFYLKEKENNIEQSTYTYHKITLREKETLRITFSNILGVNGYDIELSSDSNERNNYKQTINRRQLFDGAIDYRTVTTFVHYDKDGNSLTNTTNSYFFSTTDVYRLELYSEYSDYHFEIKKHVLDDDIFSYQIDASFLPITEIDEYQYQEIAQYFEKNAEEKNYAIMLNDLYDFVKSYNKQIRKTI